MTDYGPLDEGVTTPLQSAETDAIEDDGPECETCGKTTCADAELPGFSEPRECVFAPIYHALRDAKDCDYGCARDYTNQAIRLWVVEAVEKILDGRQREWEGAVLRRCVETMPATGEAPDFLSVVTTAMLVLREDRCSDCGHERRQHYALGHVGCHDLRCTCERVFPPAQTTSTERPERGDA